MSHSHHIKVPVSFAFIASFRPKMSFTNGFEPAVRCRIHTIIFLSMYGCVSPASGRMDVQRSVQRDPAEDDEEAAAASVHRTDGETLHGYEEL